MLLLLLLFAVYFEVHESRRKEEERKRRQREEEDVINEFMLPPIEESSGSSSSMQQLDSNLAQQRRLTVWYTKTALLYKKGGTQDIGNYRPICLLSVVYKLFTRVVLIRIGRTLDEGQPCEQAGSRKRFSIGNYRPICLLSVVYKLFTRVVLIRIGRTLDEGQPCEQAGFRTRFSTMDHIHTVIRLIEVSREYKMPLCLTFIDLKEPFDTVETEAVLEALGNQGVPTQYIRLFRELYSNFTTRISPFYDDITIDVRRGVRQDDTVSPKLFTATLEEG
ncbi:hypothetical protein Y032_0029g1863 [Ancylostoma ceylanicum]|uniref:Reverse transcriptase domain-containing protein n=1 Tax=Ancylostoma ceylanicum TaxID=53326 RepID=A0A016UQT1_9BILA|nr:hypothetical protein Y032_0029g1863 [Ancylostoma ceylanicum]